MTTIADVWEAIPSIIVAIIGSLTAMRIAAGGTRSSARNVRFWVTGGALSVGAALWSLHFIGLLALDLPIPESYGIPVTLLTVLLVVVILGFAMHAQATELSQASALLEKHTTELRATNARLEGQNAATQASEGRFHAAFEQVGVGMALRDIEPRKPHWLRVNQKLCDMLGYTREELLQLTSVDVTPPEERELAIAYNERLLRGDLTTYTREKRYVRKNGEIIWANVTLSAVRGPAGQPSYIVSVIRDITAIKEAEERMHYLAHYDSLTGVANRALFRDRLERAMARAGRNNTLVGVMFLDLDRFKEINDSLGHSTGDRVIQEVAGLLARHLRDSDSIGRLGGDEFTVILEDVAHVDEVTAVADKVLRAFADPLVVDNREIFVTASMGISIYPFAADDLEGLLQSADVAMYRAKEEGRNTYEFYAAQMNENAAKDFELETLLRRAVEREEFVLHYQPKVSAATGRITGVEALVRWNSKELGLVSPARFIPLAEKTGLILPIGEWVLKTACAQNKLWCERFGSLLISVNLSPRQFRQKNLVDVVAAAVRDAGIEPGLLELEITETSIMHSTEKAVAVLEALHELGVQLSVDDFGTGYSSLAYLKRFPVQRLKVDQSFVRGLGVNAEDSGIVAAVIALAKSLNLGVVAEGVETKEQLDLLARLACDEYQGYYFSRPVPADAFTGLLEKAAEAIGPPQRALTVASA